MMEEYQNIKILLSALKYDNYNWMVIGDFKMVAFLVGLQGGFTEWHCYISVFGIVEIQLFKKRRGTGLHKHAVRLKFTT